MKNVANNLGYWSAGLAVSLLGVAGARWLAPLTDGRLRAWLTLGGQLTALAGLLILCIGIRRRVKRDSVETS